VVPEPACERVLPGVLRQALAAGRPMLVEIEVA
jgi:hypothetical protein